MTRDTRIMVIFDTQVKPGMPLDWLGWIGQYAADKRPDHIVQIGDHWDMPSLSSYDRGTKRAEGARYRADIDAGNLAYEILNAPIEAEIDKTRRGKRGIWRPKRWRHLGNHEQRIMRYVDEHAELDGKLSYDDLVAPGWDLVGDFLEVHWIEGVAFSHYFVQKNSGRPIGGSIDNRLAKIGHSFVQGHQQELRFGRVQTGAGPARYGIVCGSSYVHDEDYRGPQAADEWRGIAMLNEVRDGELDPMFVSMNYLAKKYGGCTLAEYRAEHGL